MNKRGMLAQLVGAFVTILIAIALIPIIMEQFNQVSSSTATMNLSDSGGVGISMIESFPTIVSVMFALAILGIAMGVVYNALKTAGLVGGSSTKIKSDEGEKEIKRSCQIKTFRPGDKPKNKKSDEEISTVIISKDKEGNKKLNIKLEAGYHVDQYALEPPSEGAHLTLNEDTFKKTKYD